MAQYKTWLVALPYSYMTGHSKQPWLPDFLPSVWSSVYVRLDLEWDVLVNDDRIIIICIFSRQVLSIFALYQIKWGYPTLHLDIHHPANFSSNAARTMTYDRVEDLKIVVIMCKLWKKKKKIHIWSLWHINENINPLSTAEHNSSIVIPRIH